MHLVAILGRVCFCGSSVPAFVNCFMSCERSKCLYLGNCSGTMSVLAKLYFCLFETHRPSQDNCFHSQSTCETGLNNTHLSLVFIFPVMCCFASSLFVVHKFTQPLLFLRALPITNSGCSCHVTAPWPISRVAAFSSHTPQAPLVLTEHDTLTSTQGRSYSGGLAGYLPQGPGPFCIW